MNLIREYKKLTCDEKIEFIKLIKEDFKKIEQLDNYMTIPNFKVKEKPVKTD